MPLCIYFADRVLKLEDEAGILAVFCVPGLLGALAPALLADGLYGAGWNGTGPGDFLGVDGLGVTGLLSHFGAVAGWEGQLYAQLAGAGAAILWGFAIPWALGRVIQALSRAFRRARTA